MSHPGPDVPSAQDLTWYVGTEIVLGPARRVLCHGCPWTRPGGAARINFTAETTDEQVYETGLTHLHILPPVLRDEVTFTLALGGIWAAERLLREHGHHLLQVPAWPSTVSSCLPLTVNLSAR